METDWEALVSLSPPWAHLAVCTERTFDSLFRTLSLRRKDTVARIIRGHFCQDWFDFFRESSAALQFPYYFGFNGDAFDECINDLEWLPANHYVFGISRADVLLSYVGEAFARFVDMLGGAAEAWPSYEADRDWTKTWVTAADGTTEWGQRPIASFHVIFHCEPENEAATRDRFQKAGLSLESLHIPPSVPGR